MTHWIHLGTQRAGSSFLRSLLAQVSQVALARRKELHFFGYEKDHRYEVYLACFPERRSVLFENSPTYFRDGGKCAQPLAETLAGKPLLLSLLLRDPVEAIISHHDMRLRQGFFKGSHAYSGDPADLLSFVRRNPQYLDPWRYMHLLESHWLPRFPAEKLAIRTFEEFTSRPIETVQEFAKRAGLNDISEISPDKAWKNARFSNGLTYRFATVVNRSPSLRELRRRAMAVPVLRRLAEGLLFRQSNRSRSGDSVIGETKSELADLLREDVDRLCGFLGQHSLPWSNFWPNGTDDLAGQSRPKKHRRTTY